MSSQPSDPESYSLDEMMERLKRRDHGHGDPELVTREDGTQVVRVRKRKRRTHQPHREAEKRKARSRMLQVIFLVCAVMGLGILILGLLAYHNSRTFQQRLLDKIATVTGAETELTQFRVTPVGASAQSATLLWHAHPELRELRLNLVNADLRMTSFVGGVWSGEEVFARSGTLILGVPDAAGANPAIPGDDGSAMGSFRFNRYRCEELQFLFGRGGRPPLQARGVESSIYRTASGIQMRLSGGTLAASGWPELRLDRGLIEFGPGEVNVSSLRFNGGAPAGLVEGEAKAWSPGRAEDSALECQGSFDPRSERQVFLDVTCQRFPSEGLLGKSFSRLFTMVLDGKGTLAFVPNDFASHELVLPFEASAAADGAYLAGLPFLDLLKTELQEARFAVPQFQNEAEGVLRRRGGAIELSDLRLEQKSFLAIRGKMVVGADGSLSGHFDVGVADRLMSAVESTRFVRRAFAETRDGYRWAHVKLSGTVQSPKDDFAATLKAAYQTPLREEDATAPAAHDGTPDSPPRDPGKEFEDLIKGGGNNQPDGEGR